jgi:tetrahydromethanopterin S-methyltransferase subunit F
LRLRRADVQPQARNRSLPFGVVQPTHTEGGIAVGILWIILIVILVLALLGFFARGF